MNQTHHRFRRLHPKVRDVLILISLLTLTATPAWAQKSEIIEATATGTNTQMGEVVDVRLEIYAFSTMEDRQTLVNAFEKGQNQGLVNALSKMKAMGHVSLSGTLGYDCSFIRLIPTPTGRKIRFVTNRPIHFAEAWSDSQSQAFNLTAGEIDLNDEEKNKSSGQLFPAAQLVIDKQGQLQFDLNQNAWKLVDIIDWKGTQGVN
jgi:hypothetical protein